MSAQFPLLIGFVLLPYSIQARAGNVNPRGAYRGKAFDSVRPARYNRAMQEDGGIHKGFLSGNALKLFACVCMLIDHTGAILFPETAALRAVGRLAMPLFAFTFAEGCFYTRRRLTHFMLVLGIGLVTSAGFSLAEGALRGDIMISFTMASLVIWALDSLKRGVFRRDARRAVLSAAGLLAALALATWVCCFSSVRVDYGLAGVLLPVTVRLLDFRSYGGKGLAAELHQPALTALLFTVCLIAIALPRGDMQFLSLLALPLIVLYNGRRGKYRLKYFFYAFYPLHLALLAAIYLALNPAYLSALFA